MYNIRLSLKKAALHRTNTARAANSPLPAFSRGEGWGGVLRPGLATLLTVDLLLFALVIIRILEARGW